MMWNPRNDCFTFRLKFHKISKEILVGVKILTKRQVPKTAMSVFDPIGIFSPIIVEVKILFQNIWRAGLGRDDCITESFFRKWLAWLEQLNKVMRIGIPRYYSYSGSDMLKQ
ncbi:hypothetical protein JTB14_024388 [Gonioctena quinquepunctata]|nr:hypothetical protein JTB14_024388 [Gonioctena quinquepunctata]